MRLQQIIVMLIIALSLVGCQTNEDEDKNTIQGLGKKDHPDKNVVFVILDSMMGSLVENSKEKGMVPAIDFLMENGQYYNDLVSPFPSMSVNIESTILTGTMADNHQVPGLVWYKQDEDRLVDYGSTIEKMLKLGLTQSLQDSLYHLNNTHLNPQTTTIFEELQQERLTTGSVNMIVYRGESEHELTLPPLLDGLVSPNGPLLTKGPDLLAFGSAIKPNVIANQPLPDSIYQRFGLNDEYSIEVTKALIKNNQQPNFLAVFLPNFDKEAHEHGPHYRRGFERAELLFQEILNSYDSWEQALEENIFIIIGDHGQDKLKSDKDEMLINLDSIYNDYQISTLRENISNGEIAFANNHRSAYVYSLHDPTLIPSLAETAMVDHRISFSAWQEDDWIYVLSPNQEQTLRFKPGGQWNDRYDQSWTIEGNEAILTLELDPTMNEIHYQDYPDALNQLYSSLNSHPGSYLVLNAKPGYSFASEGAPEHEGGGEHGGMHKNDTLAAMIIAGTDQQPKYRRMVDLKDFFKQLVTP
ncbi:alkaline phosphatase family protein [Desertibacillus haloalkaliphilus]|uniref:alkaline phosphatase family protein n=1 Tax=Desertibacillus haloalkaliphilus TaxID=1328930 RepID=UPI001C27E427|nr:alkaline phosphatase family protein [Desertibacillus haloalkaliphilus]MBU8907161.1 alkaline phosphatase family protein [Desertibacillus haloalkaliphilus]